MKQISILFIACLFFQVAQGQHARSRHSFQAQTGFAYASDLAYEEEMKRNFLGMGYQYTTKTNWYFGTDVQYHRNQLNSDRLLPLQMQGEGTLYACRIPGALNGTGYFFLPQSMQTSVSIITNTNVFKTGSNKVPIQTQALEASRLNFMFHTGRRWNTGAGVIEAGITVTGTLYNRDVVRSNMQQQSIACRSLITGEVFNNMFDVTSYGIVNERTFWAGAGFHARYQYPVSKTISIGVQVLGSMSVEGILLQAAPRMVISL